MTKEEIKEAITRQVRRVRYREQSLRDCVDNIESMIEALNICSVSCISTIDLKKELEKRGAIVITKQDRSIGKGCS